MSIRTIALEADGVALWLAVRDDTLPEVVHWGAPLTASATDLAEGMLASEPTLVDNGVDVPIRVSVLPEARTGFMGRVGVEGHRGGEAWSPQWQVESVAVDGMSLEGDWSGGPGEVRIDATDHEAALGLELLIALLPSGLVRTRASVTNLSADVYTVSAVTVRLPVPPRATELLDLTGHWAAERLPQRLPFAIGSHVRESRRGRTGADAATVLHAGEPGFGFAAGEVWGVHVAWSGNHVHVAERLVAGRWLGGGEYLLPGEIVLGLGESYGSPWVYGSYGVGLDDLAHRFHDHLRALPGHPRSPRPVTMNSWEAVHFDHDIDELGRLVDEAAALGVERFVLNDGWFGSRRDATRGLGDWTVSSDLYPDGLHPLVNRVTGHGMQFGLWFEPEMVNPDSDLARAHPDWILQVPGRTPPLSRNQQVLDLTNPDCFAYVRDAMVALLDEYAIGYIKWDHNRDLVDAGSAARRGRPAVHAQTAATYRLMRSLKEHQPGLEIESCSSGGGRVDLGVMEICDRVWASDNTDAVDRLGIQRWTLQLLPPELVGNHIGSNPSHQTGRRHSVAARAATALVGHLGIECDIRTVTDAERAELRSWVRLYKGLRPLLHTGRVVRGDDAGVWLTGVVSPDATRAVYVLSVVESSKPEVRYGRVRLPGLDPARRYAVRPIVATGPSVSPHGRPAWFGAEEGDGYAGTTVSGAWLSREGLTAPALWSDSPVVLLVREV